MALKTEQKHQVTVWGGFWHSVSGAAWTSASTWESFEPSELHDRYAGHCLHSRQDTQKELITQDSPSDFRSLLSSYARDTFEKVETPEMRLAVLEKVVLELRHFVTELSSCKTIYVPISSLAPEPFDLEQTIYAVVEPVDDEFVATFYDANINASGDTREDAVENLKDVLLSTFRRYSELREDQLGAGARKQFAVLQSLLTPK